MAHINSLPRAMLTIIFKSLSVKDRKSIRLTCPLWYEVCNSSEFNEDEKFAIYCADNEDDVAEITVPEHTRWPCASRTHWEFHGLERLPLFLWKTCCAAKIQSLFIYNCVIHELTFVQIVEYCKNLIRFCIEVNEVDPAEGTPSLKPLFGSDKTPLMDRLIRRGIKQTKLTSFEIYSFYEPECILSTLMKQKIFEVYTNIRTFCYGYGRRPERFMDFFTATDDCTNRAFPLKIPESLRSMLPLKKLKELKAYYTDENENRAVLLKYLSLQPELERLGLKTDLRTESKPYLLFQILESLPKLKEFMYGGLVCGNSVVILSPTEFQQFIEYIDNLEALALRNNSLYLDPFLRSHDERFKWTRLKKLYLGPAIEEAIVLEILERCGPALKFRRLDLTVNRTIAQKLFEIDTSLETLQVTRFEDIYTYPYFSPDYDYFRSRFRNLKRLDLKQISGFDFDVFMFELNASKLEYITFPRSFIYTSTEEQQNKIIEKALLILALHSPPLRIICFNETIPLEPFGLLEICKRLEKLEIIYVRKSFVSLKNLVDKSYDLVVRLFIECPSLRWLVSDGLFNYTYDHCSMNLMEYGYRASTFMEEYNAWYRD